MQIHGLGTDIIEIVRIGRMIERHGELFLTRVFTDAEVKYCSKSKNCTQHYAARWAAKEAVLKALGSGMVRGLSWQDIEVLPDRGGKPNVTLRGGTRERCDQRGIEGFMVTLSHCRSYATATAIAISG